MTPGQQDWYALPVAKNPNSKICKAKSQVYGEDGWPIVGDDGKPMYKPCQKYAMRGLDVCSVHGGRAQVAKAKGQQVAERERWERNVQDLLAECDMPQLHPMDELLDVVRRTGAMVRMLGSLVGMLEPGPTAEIVITDKGEVHGAYRATSIYGPNHQGDGAPHVLTVMYGQWMDRHARACKLALDANIDERMIRNAEATTEALFGAVSAALNAAELTHEQQDAFKIVLADELRRLVGPDAQPALAAG